MAVNPDEIPRYAPPTQAELEEMFGERELPCWTCRHRDELWTGTSMVAGRRVRAAEEWCLAAHDNGGNGDNFPITAQDVPDPCPSWEEE